ncbi:DUF6318 family protein [Actinotalea sp. AC32]|nr:DUF6318 family protein [Actinotalea sp. AC32]
MKRTQVRPHAGARRRRGAPIALVVAVGAAVVGCTGEPGGEPTPTWTVNPSPSVPEATPTPTQEPITAPERPAEMDRMDEIGAVAAAEYFLELQEYAVRTGDLAEWRQVSRPDCEFCRGMSESVQRVYDGGGAYTGRAFTAGDARVIGHDEVLGVFAVEAEFVAAPGHEVDAAGAPVVDIPLEDGFMTLDVLIVDGEWSLLGVVVTEGSLS